MTMNAVNIAPDKLRIFSAAVLTAHGVPSADATLVADSLVTADLWGAFVAQCVETPWYRASSERVSALRTHATSSSTSATDSLVMATA
jgi:LDH2 family malate/lactate/ureidoglycolate dehydrogenase